MNSEPVVPDPVRILTARGAGFRLRTHPVMESTRDVGELLGVGLDRTVKTLAFVTSDDRLVLAALPGHARLRYGPLARAAGVRRAELAPAGPERLAALDMVPGGVCPVCSDEGATVVFDERVPGMGRIHCGSGRRDSSVEIDAAELVALVPSAKTADIAGLPEPEPDPGPPDPNPEPDADAGPAPAPGPPDADAGPAPAPDAGSAPGPTPGEATGTGGA